jgi:hypothetical protein
MNKAEQLLIMSLVAILTCFGTMFYVMRPDPVAQQEKKNKIEQEQTAVGAQTETEIRNKQEQAAVGAQTETEIRNGQLQARKQELEQRRKKAIQEADKAGTFVWPPPEVKINFSPSPISVFEACRNGGSGQGSPGCIRYQESMTVPFDQNVESVAKPPWAVNIHPAYRR